MIKAQGTTVKLLSDGVSKQLEALTESEAKQWPRIRKSVAVMTASQTRWHPLGPVQSRPLLCKQCIDMMKSKGLELPRSMQLVMESAAAPTDASSGTNVKKEDSKKRAATLQQKGG